MLGLESATWKLPVKRRKEGKPDAEHTRGRVMFGSIPNAVSIHEGELQFTVSPGLGQKTGGFLDLRALRKWVSLQPLAGKRVLNLFSYTGMLSRAAESAGASMIWSCDTSQGALDFAKAHHATDRKKHQWHAVDIFQWLPQLETSPFDLVICDPPMVVARKEQIPVALKSYRKLFSAAKHVAPKGRLVACCCSSRIERQIFRQTVSQVLGPGFEFEKSLGPEDDHPIGFAEGDYLKILIFRRK
jgi:23S rRNA (cytosine1962-C5)-methyltransferase